MKQAVLVFLLAATAFAANEKTFDATYTAIVSEVPAGLKELTVWIPLPASRGSQRVSSISIDPPYDWKRMREKEFGNDYVVATIRNPPAGTIEVPVRFMVTRAEAKIDEPAEKSASEGELRRALRAEKLVTLSPRVKKLAKEVTGGRRTPMEKARAIYDHLLLTMKYDKTIPGWGQGDTERACDIRAGNCTDFHSLFISLARASGIPARFVIGFPLTAADGQVKGYHCWAEFWVQGKGWIPVDASDAAKSNDPRLREYLFGNLDPDRVQFTIGRDLVLEPRTSTTLNYFIYPRAESAGATVGTASIALQFKATASQ